MCRLLGIVSAAPYDFNLVLCEAPRSMVKLSREHRDGWGMATHAGTAGTDWSLHRSTLTASDDPTFSELAHQTQGRITIAHVRQKTVGPVRRENTHPFQRGNWVFAHNGTVKDVTWLREQVSELRLGEIRGDTDSELFFAFLLSRLDAAELTTAPVGPATDEVIRSALLEATARSDFGSLDALLSNGEALYVARFGRPLFFLERVPDGRWPGAVESGAVPVARRHCLVVASEPLTDEAWTPLEPGTLLRMQADPEPRSTDLA